MSPVPPAEPPGPATSPRGVVRALFAVGSSGASGLFLVDVGGAVARLELERGWVHAMSNVPERRPWDEGSLRRYLLALPDVARGEFRERPAGGPLLGFRVTPFHPSRTARAWFEGRAEAARDFTAARLRLRLAPHGSCLDGDEPSIVSLLASPRRFEELLAFSPRPRLLRLLAFLDAAGALLVEDAAFAEALALLGLSEGAAPDEVKRAYRRLAAEVHPDRHPGAGESERRALEARFHALREAYLRLLPTG